MRPQPKKRRVFLTPLDYDFFFIGNTEKCRPCLIAHQKLEEYITDETFGEWLFDTDSKSPSDPLAKMWLEEQREKDPLLSGHRTIPMIWKDGRFIGGKDELLKIIESNK